MNQIFEWKLHISEYFHSFIFLQLYFQIHLLIQKSVLICKTQAMEYAGVKEILLLKKKD